MFVYEILTCGSVVAYEVIFVYERSFLIKCISQDLPLRLDNEFLFKVPDTK